MSVLSPRLELPPTQTRFSPARLAGFAVEALLEEAALTPKPALVDLRGRGAHHDLDLATMTRSAQALRPTFAALAAASAGASPSPVLRERLAVLGRRGEREMLAVTGGSNTHRGAIWIVGLLVAGSVLVAEEDGGAPEEHGLPQRICDTGAAIARYPDRFAPVLESHGRQVARQYQVGGARQEACDGFPHVRAIGLPALAAARRRGIDEDRARLDALLAIMGSLADTCLLHRGGRAALQAAQDGAQRVLDLGGSSTAKGYAALLELDAQLLELNASPGGAADLLAATLLLDKLLHCNPHQEV